MVVDLRMEAIANISNNNHHIQPRRHHHLPSNNPCTIPINRTEGHPSTRRRLPLRLLNGNKVRFCHRLHHLLLQRTRHHTLLLPPPPILTPVLECSSPRRRHLLQVNLHRRLRHSMTPDMVATMANNNPRNHHSSSISLMVGVFHLHPSNSLNLNSILVTHPKGSHRLHHCLVVHSRHTRVIRVRHPRLLRRRHILLEGIHSRGMDAERGVEAGGLQSVILRVL
jgi:hypothetical protein